MTMKPRIIHLISDMSLGGVTKNLEIFDQDNLAMKYDSTIVQAETEWKLAGKYDADIIITHFSPSWANLPFLYALKRRNRQSKIIHMEHSYSPEWEAHSVTDTARFRAMLRLSYAQFDKIICVSKTQSKWLNIIDAVSQNKHHIINPWSDMDNLFPLESPSFDNHKPLTIGSYGRLVKEKGFEDLIQSFLQISGDDDISLLIGGYGPDEEHLKELAKGDPRIIFYGLVDDLADFMKQCDIVAIPSYYETYGLVATEARAAARPILVSPVGALVEQMGNAGVTVDFKNHRNAAMILSSLRQLPLESMATEARKSSRNISSKNVNNWCRFIDHLIYSETCFSKAA